MANLLGRNWDRLIVCGAWLFFFLGIPISAIEGDSGWFYMAVHYLQTGTYRYGSGLTAFNGPCLYHNPFGYPAFIALAKLLGGEQWPLFLHLLQGAAYTGGYEACRRFCEIVSGRPRPVILPFVYLAQFTTLEYSHYVLSECVSALFLSASICLAVACLADAEGRRPALRVWLGICAAETIFLKAVCLPIMIAICAWLLLAPGRRRTMESIPTAILTATLVISMTFNSIYFKNFALKGNWGWNIFNRVVHKDGRLNTSGAVTQAVIELIGRPITRDWFWWDLQDALGRKGFTLDETSLVAEAIAIEGIKTYPVEFVFKTFINAYRLAVTTDALTQTRPDLESWLKSQETLRRGQGTYLMDELLSAWPHWKARFSISGHAYPWFDGIYRRGLGYLMANAAWLAVYIWAIICPPKASLYAKSPLGLRLLFAAPALVLIGSAASEHTFFRYKVPVMPLLHTIAICKIVELYYMHVAKSDQHAENNGRNKQNAEGK